MNLKAAMANDLPVFFNPDEFGSVAVIGGSPILVTLDEESLKEYNANVAEGLAVGELLFHAPVSSFVEKPFIDMRLTVNNRIYEIIDIKENIGVYSIVLAGYRS